MFGGGRGDGDDDDGDVKVEEGGSIKLEEDGKGRRDSSVERRGSVGRRTSRK